jgi:hypothetical protein
MCVKKKINIVFSGDVQEALYTRGMLMINSLFVIINENYNCNHRMPFVCIRIILI